MNLGGPIRLGGKIGLWFVAGCSVFMLILFLGGDRLNALAAHVIVGGDGKDPSVLESYGFILVYFSIFILLVGAVSLVAFWLGGVLRSRGASA